jgi:hypothetical protein
MRHPNSVRLCASVLIACLLSESLFVARASAEPIPAKAQLQARKTSARIFEHKQARLGSHELRDHLRTGLESLAGASNGAAGSLIKNKLPALSALLVEGDQQKIKSFKLTWTRTLGDVFHETETAHLLMEATMARYESLRAEIAKRPSGDPVAAKLETLAESVAREYLGQAMVFARNVDLYLPLSRFIYRKHDRLLKIVAPRISARPEILDEPMLESMFMMPEPAQAPKRSLEVDQNTEFASIFNLFDTLGARDDRAPSVLLASDRAFERELKRVTPAARPSSRQQAYKLLDALNSRREGMKERIRGEIARFAQASADEQRPEKLLETMNDGTLLERDRLKLRISEEAVRYQLLSVRLGRELSRVGKRALLAVDAVQWLHALEGHAPFAKALNSAPLKSFMEMLLSEKRNADWQERWGQTLGELNLREAHETTPGNLAEGVRNLLATYRPSERGSFAVYEYLARRQDLDGLWEKVSGELLSRQQTDPELRAKIEELGAQRERHDFAWINPNYKPYSPIGILTTGALAAIALYFGIVPLPGGDAPGAAFVNFGADPCAEKPGSIGCSPGK